MTDTTPPVLTNSMQMYLVTIARLREDGQPVPLSRLADSLSVSPVSVNEMCHRLQDDGLVIYRPYKGASLTDEGERRAFHILRRHRLWEVFLVDRLGFDYEQAHEIACQLEHATPDLLADRLDIFLEHPAVNPQGEPIPRDDAAGPPRILIPLVKLPVGRRGQVVRWDVSPSARTFLTEQGLRPGVTLEVTAIAGESVLVLVDGQHISLARDLAKAVQVEMKEKEEPHSEVTSESPHPTSTRTKKEEVPEMQTKTETTARQIPLHKLNPGQRGIVVRVGGKGPARRRMMDMGLVPGSEVRVVRVAPLGDPIEFTVKGYSLSLRKSEAKAITVEVTD